MNALEVGGSVFVIHVMEGDFDTVTRITINHFSIDDPFFKSGPRMSRQTLLLLSPFPRICMTLPINDSIISSQRFLKQLGAMQSIRSTTAEADNEID